MKNEEPPNIVKFERVPCFWPLVLVKLLGQLFSLYGFFISSYAVLFYCFM